MRPTFIGIGAQKCASTWLHEALASHPDIGASLVKELDFFAHNYECGFAWYESQFADFDGRAAVGEISPSYFHHTEAPARARAYNADLRVIVSLRDPIERAFSNHLHAVKLGWVAADQHGFERGLENCPMYLEQSRYATHLSRWLSEFPRDAIHVLLQEDVASDPEGELSRLFRFLGVAPDRPRAPVRRVANQSSVPRNRRLDRGLKTAGQALRALGLGSVVTTVKNQGLVRALRQRNRIELREVLPPPQPATVERLQRELADDVDFVRRLLGREHLPWKHFRA